MIKLNDKDIRIHLIKFLNKYKPKKIVEELRVHNGNAIADVVTVNNILHCYEIKGDNDSIIRAVKQAEFYNKCFPKITLVTTENHFNNAVSKIPFFWGIIICKYTEDGVVFTYRRRSSYNPFLDKKQALLTLWKKELEEISKEFLQIKINRNLSREIYANEISKIITKNDLSFFISKSIHNRESFI